MGQSKSKMLSPDAISVKKKGFLYYLKRDWQLYALLLLPMAFIIVFKYLLTQACRSLFWTTRSARAMQAVNLSG